MRHGALCLRPDESAVRCDGEELETRMVAEVQRRRHLRRSTAGLIPCRNSRARIPEACVPLRMRACVRACVQRTEQCTAPVAHAAHTSRECTAASPAQASTASMHARHRAHRASEVPAVQRDFDEQHAAQLARRREADDPAVLELAAHLATRPTDRPRVHATWHVACCPLYAMWQMTRPLLNSL